ncbi:hypothetical protein [Mycobacterium sp. MMS18-G62]
MGRHELARDRRKSSAVLAAFVAPAAVFFAAGADVHPTAADAVVRTAAHAADTMATPCCMEIVTAASVVGASAPSLGHSTMNAAPERVVTASRWRVVDVPRLLPKGIASEQGLQVRTILAARSISAAFPEIHQMDGVRPDPLPWHPNGLALDIMIPNPSSAEGIELGNEIVAYALKNANRFDLQDAIWRGIYYTPSGPQGSGMGHFDHVHITTHGDGYPTGDEKYYR